MAALAVACFFVALVAEGDSLSCVFCSNIGDTICSGVLTKCGDSTDTCFTAIIATTFAGRITSIVNRACGKSTTDCKTGSMSAPQSNITISAGCCASDECTPVVPPLPSSSSHPNGMICPACFSESSSFCNTSETMTCTGQEKKCISNSVSTKGQVSSNMAFRGCATESFCDYGGISATSEGITVTTNQTCTGSSIRLECGAFLPAVTALFLLRTVF